MFIKIVILYVLVLNFLKFLLIKLWVNRIDDNLLSLMD